MDRIRDLDDGRVVPNFINQALAGDPITIYGDGTQTRSFCYVSDLVDGLIAAMMRDNLAGQVFNLGNPEEHTISEFAGIVSQVVAELDGGTWNAGHQDVVWHDLPQDDPTRRQPDIERLVPCSAGAQESPCETGYDGRLRGSERTYRTAAWLSWPLQAQVRSDGYV